MPVCNCKWQTVDPNRHEANCDIVLTVRLRSKTRELEAYGKLIPFPGLEPFHTAKLQSLQKEVDSLTRRLTRKDTPKRKP